MSGAGWIDKTSVETTRAAGGGEWQREEPRGCNMIGRRRENLAGGLPSPLAVLGEGVGEKEGRKGEWDPNSRGGHARKDAVDVLLSYKK